MSKTEMTTDPVEAENEINQFGYAVAHAQEKERTAEPFEAQGINAGDEDAEGESD